VNRSLFNGGALHHQGFTEAEQKRLSGILFERDTMPVSIQLADSELQLGGDPSRSYRLSNYLLE
jgi:hypothetical protein